jgi:(p)ppGpp synthase/HD superfamily hydrolase
MSAKIKQKATTISGLEHSASVFATAAHARVNQHRRYTDAPYIEHPAAVAEIVRGVPHDDEMLAAAWLHDTVEDTGTSISEIVREFGAEVGMLVEQLTDVSRPGDGGRAARKAIDLRHTAGSSPRAKTIKLADIIDNTSTIVRYDPEFARVYIPEKATLLEVLTEGDVGLYWRARIIADAAFKRLGLPPAHR